MIKLTFVLFVAFTAFVGVIHCNHDKHNHNQGHAERRPDPLRFTSPSFDFDQLEDEDLDNEALLGGRQNADEFSKLSSDQAKMYVQNLMSKSKMDTNEDGFVSFRELLRWIEQSFGRMAQEESDEMFTEEDKNGDGKLDWHEHHANNFNLEDPESKETIQLLQEDRLMWQAADLNRDGSLNSHEYSLFTSPEDHPEMQDVVYNLTMNRRDRDQDNKLSFDEYIRGEDGQIPDKSSENYAVEKDRFEKDLDTDKDGFLGKNEILSWIIPNDQQSALIEAEHLMELCDDDKDDKLSLEELTKHISELANSEATNFGEHLSASVHDEL
jgi:Ca2+-binding EF-hand superfamily protein